MAALNKRFRELARHAPAKARSPHPRRRSPHRAVSDGESEKLIDAIRRLAGLDPAQTREREARRKLLKAFTPGAAFANRTFNRLALGAASLAKISFTETVFKNVQFQGCGLSGATFHHCRFEWVDFTGADCEKASFVQCRFKHCLFQIAGLNETAFHECAFTGTHFSDASAKSPAFSLCAFNECDFLGFRAVQARFYNCGFVRANFSLAAMNGLICQGVSFVECCFEKTFLSNARLESARVQSGYFQDCRFINVRADGPIPLSVRAASRKTLLHKAALSLPADFPPPPLAQKGVASLAGKCVETWLVLEEAEKRLRRILRANARRLDWAGFKMGDKAARFLTMLPGLIEADKVMRENGFERAIPAKIAGYAPDREGAALLAKTLGAAPASARPDQGNPSLPIQAVYAMGSAGAIAQTKSSDLDVWVCYEAGDASPGDRARLSEKLEAIALLAEKESGLEIHFFPMSVEDVRENKFGFSDEESCGSAQAMLLKEEFYRTALVLAGKAPLWWMTPPGAPQASYQAMKKRLARLGPLYAGLFTDLGGLGEIGGPEYFGASLWLIVKSLKNPFKSVMKIGLLEKYLRGQEDGGLISDRIKANLCQGNDGVWETDPYALLFRDVNAYYESLDDRESMAFLRTAFIQKTGMDPVDRVPAAQGEDHGGRGVEFFFPFRGRSSLGVPATGAAGEHAEKAASPFHELMALGDRFAVFLSRAYENLMASGGDAKDGVAKSAPAISERDLAMLGRKIASRFRKRPGKIMRLPFVSPPKDMFSALEIVYDDKAREPAWTALGEARGKRKGESEEIRRDRSLERLGAWLLANDLLFPETYLKGGALAAPISFPDVQELFAALRAAFPPRLSFEPPLVEYLRPERAVAALMTVNLSVPREERGIAEISLLYVTNWGELFFLEKTAGLHLLEDKPFDFLRYNIPVELDPAPRVETFTPAKAQCFKLSLSLYG